MPYNLLVDPLFPVVTGSGERKFIRFAQLSEQGAEAPVDFDWPRPDLNIASHEFCVGVLSVAFQPDEHVWGDLWGGPPDRATLDEMLAPLLPAFNLDGDGPRFMQAFEDLGDDGPNPVEGLFIDTPGANGQKKNTDVLTHRDRFPALGLPAAAMALYAMQQFAPAGGAGNRTSMRGGGPMTTLVMPGAARDAPASLWRRIVANLPPTDAVELSDANLRRIFPWMAPTLLSDKASGERVIQQGDPAVHPLHAYFGTPRRIRLIRGGDGRCGLTGTPGPLVTGFVQKPWGMNYGLWQHPLTPYRQQKQDTEFFSAKPKSGRFGYRDWVAVTCASGDGGLARPSANIAAAQQRTRLIGGDSGSPSMLVAGWAMSNMEAITYLHTDQPLYLVADAARRVRVEHLARGMATAGDAAHDILRGAVRRANFAEGATVATDAGMFVELRSAFFERTDRTFHEILSEMAHEDGDPEKLAERWRRAMKRVAIELFERHAPDPARSPQAGQRFAAAYKGLAFAFEGQGPAGRRLFEALNLPLPEKKSAREKA